MKVQGIHHRTVWFESGNVHLIDQPLLPFQFSIVRLTDHQQTALAIHNMTVRGAGAIGATAGFGMAQALLEAPQSEPQAYIREAAARLRATRPTAQNLFYAIDRVLAASEPFLQTGDLIRARDQGVLEAQRIADEDAAACQQIGECGAALIEDGARVATHCNAGWLAFVDWGSALSPIYSAHRQGKSVFVWVDETRPRRQGARLTAWELGQEKVPHKILCDGASASLMRNSLVDLVIVGSDRIAANGDVANKIGTYPAALAAREAHIPFYVAAPSSTLDPTCPSGVEIPIEERGQEEVHYIWGRLDSGEQARVRVTPEGSEAGNPAFDITPASLVTGIITEFGIIEASPAGITAAIQARGTAYGSSSTTP